MLRQHSGRKKPVLRWRPSAFEDRCTQWDGQGIGPNNECYAEARGYDCRGCVHIPAKARRRMHMLDVADRVFGRRALVLEKLMGPIGSGMPIELLQTPVSAVSKAVDNSELVHNEWKNGECKITVDIVGKFAESPLDDGPPPRVYGMTDRDRANVSKAIASYRSSMPEGAKDLKVSYSLCHDVDNPNLIQN